MSTKQNATALEVKEPQRPFINTWLTFSPDQADVYEYVSPISETVPDMETDLRLMLERSASGIPVPMRNDGFSEDDYPDIWKMDEFELAAFREELADQMTNMKDELHVASKRLEEIQEEERKKSVTNTDEKPKKSAPKEPKQDD